MTSISRARNATSFNVDSVIDVTKAKVKSLLSCPLCRQTYQDARLLPCDHTFCLRCLQRFCDDLQKSRRSKVGSFECPTCGSLIGLPPAGVSGFPEDARVGKVRDQAVEALARRISEKQQSSSSKKDLEGVGADDCADYIDVDIEAAPDGYEESRDGVSFGSSLFHSNSGINMGGRFSRLSRNRPGYSSMREFRVPTAGLVRNKSFTTTDKFTGSVNGDDTEVHASNEFDYISPVIGKNRTGYSSLRDRRRKLDSENGGSTSTDLGGSIRRTSMIPNFYYSEKPLSTMTTDVISKDTTTPAKDFYESRYENITSRNNGVDNDEESSHRKGTSSGIGFRKRTSILNSNIFDRPDHQENDQGNGTQSYHEDLGALPELSTAEFLSRLPRRAVSMRAPSSKPFLDVLRRANQEEQERQNVNNSSRKEISQKQTSSEAINHGKSHQDVALDRSKNVMSNGTTVEKLPKRKVIFPDSTRDWSTTSTNTAATKTTERIIPSFEDNGHKQASFSQTTPSEAFDGESVFSRLANFRRSNRGEYSTIPRPSGVAASFPSKERSTAFSALDRVNESSTEVKSEDVQKTSQNPETTAQKSQKERSEKTYDLQNNHAAEKSCNGLLNGGKEFIVRPRRQQASAAEPSEAEQARIETTRSAPSQLPDSPDSSSKKHNTPDGALHGPGQSQQSNKVTNEKTNPTNDKESAAQQKTNNSPKENNIVRRSSSNKAGERTTSEYDGLIDGFFSPCFDGAGAENAESGGNDKTKPKCASNKVNSRSLKERVSEQAPEILINSQNNNNSDPKASAEPFKNIDDKTARKSKIPVVFDSPQTNETTNKNGEVNTETNKNNEINREMKTRPAESSKNDTDKKRSESSRPKIKVVFDAPSCKLNALREKLSKEVSDRNDINNNNNVKSDRTAAGPASSKSEIKAPSTIRTNSRDVGSAKNPSSPKQDVPVILQDKLFSNKLPNAQKQSAEPKIKEDALPKVTKNEQKSFQNSHTSNKENETANFSNNNQTSSNHRESNEPPRFTRNVTYGSMRERRTPCEFFDESVINKTQTESDEVKKRAEFKRTQSVNTEKPSRSSNERTDFYRQGSDDTGEGFRSERRNEEKKPRVSLFDDSTPESFDFTFNRESCEESTLRRNVHARQSMRRASSSDRTNQHSRGSSFFNNNTSDSSSLPFMRQTTQPTDPPLLETSPSLKRRNRTSISDINQEKASLNSGTATLLHTSAEQYEMPTAIAVLSKGNTVVTDYGDACLKFYYSDGTACHSVNGIKPFSVAVHPTNDRVVVGDRKNRTVCIYDEFGTDVAQWESDMFKWICGVAVLRNGNLAILDRAKSTIGIYSLGGQLIREFGSYGGADGQLCMGEFIATDSMDRILTCDSGNHCIKAFLPDGKMIGKFGNGRGSADGELQWPKGVCVDGKDNIIVADTRNSRVSMFAPDGEFVQQLITDIHSPYAVCYAHDDKMAVTLYSVTGPSHYRLYGI